MLFSLNLTSAEGLTEGRIQWAEIDPDYSSLSISGVDVPISESSGTTSFSLDGLTDIDFETGGSSVDLPEAEFPELSPGIIDILGQDLLLI